MPPLLTGPAARTHPPPHTLPPLPGPPLPGQLLDKVDAHIRRQPKVSGNYEQILGRSLEGLVNRAEELKTKWQVGAWGRVISNTGWAGALCVCMCVCACRGCWGNRVGLLACCQLTPSRACACARPQDQYVSVEELVMAMADDERFGAQLFREQARCCSGGC